MISCLYCGLCIPVKRRSENVIIRTGEKPIHTKGSRIQNIPITETTTTKTIPTIRQSVANRYRQDKDRLQSYYYSIKYLLCRGDISILYQDISNNPDWRNVKILEKNGILIFYLYPAGSSKPLHVSWYEVRNAKLEFKYYDILYSTWADYKQIRNIIKTEVKFTGGKFTHVNVLEWIPKSTENHPSNTSTSSTADVIKFTNISKTTIVTTFSNKIISTTASTPLMETSAIADIKSSSQMGDTLHLIKYYSIQYLNCMGKVKCTYDKITPRVRKRILNVTRMVVTKDVIIFYLRTPASEGSRLVHISWQIVKNSTGQTTAYDVLYSTWADYKHLRLLFDTKQKYSEPPQVDVFIWILEDIKSNNKKVLIKKEKQRNLKATFVRFLRRLAKLFTKTSKEI